MITLHLKQRRPHKKSIPEVGTIVKIRNDLVGDRYYGKVYFNPVMEQYCGKVMKISRKNNDEFDSFSLENTPWIWSKEMMEPLK